MRTLSRHQVSVKDLSKTFEEQIERTSEEVEKRKNFEERKHLELERRRYHEKVCFGDVFLCQKWRFTVFQMGQPRPLFVNFRSFQTKILQKKTVGVSGIWTWIVGVEGEHADHHHGPWWYIVGRPFIAEIMLPQKFRFKEFTSDRDQWLQSIMIKWLDDQSHFWEL